MIRKILVILTTMLLFSTITPYALEDIGPDVLIQPITENISENQSNSKNMYLFLKYTRIDAKNKIVKGYYVIHNFKLYKYTDDTLKVSSKDENNFIHLVLCEYQKSEDKDLKYIRDDGTTFEFEYFWVKKTDNKKLEIVSV